MGDGSVGKVILVWCLVISRHLKGWGQSFTPLKLWQFVLLDILSLQRKKKKKKEGEKSHAYECQTVLVSPRVISVMVEDDWCSSFQMKHDQGGGGTRIPDL